MGEGERYFRGSENCFTIVLMCWETVSEVSRMTPRLQRKGEREGVELLKVREKSLVVKVREFGPMVLIFYLFYVIFCHHFFPITSPMTLLYMFFNILIISFFSCQQYVLKFLRTCYNYEISLKFKV